MPPRLARMAFSSFLMGIFLWIEIKILCEEQWSMT